MKKRTWISALLIMAMILSLFSPIGAYAEELSPTVTVESVQAKPGETVDVKVSIANNLGFLGAALMVSYDEGLELVNSKAGDGFAALAMTKPGQYASPCKFVWDAVDIEPEDIVDGEIMTLTFKVSDTVQGGTNLNVNVSYDAGDFINTALEPVEIQVVNGIISVKSYTPGDVSGDGQVTTADVVLIRRYIAGGYDVSFLLDAADVNADAKINTLDVILIRRFIAGGYTDENGDPIVLKEGRVSEGLCVHNMTATDYKAPTCTEDGNIAYWYCNNCKKFFRDANGVNEVSEANIVIKATGHTPEIDPAVPATTTKTGLTEGSHCSVCNEILIPQEVVPKLDDNREKYQITYYIDQDDSYIRSLNLENKNPEYYYSEDGLKLQNLKANGLIFDGWYDAEGASGQLVREIPKGQTGDIELYAKWTLREYTIAFDSPLAPIESIKYTVNKGATLTNPKWFGYNFMGWSDDENKIVTSIPKGTVGNITLHANWMSKRNQTRSVKNLENPIIYEDEDKGQYLFVYEIGQIENVPLYTIKDFGNANGITIEETISSTGSIINTRAQEIAKSVADATTNTTTWALSKNWNNSTTHIYTHTDESGMEISETESLAGKDTSVVVTGVESGHSNTVTNTNSTNLTGKIGFGRTDGASAKFKGLGVSKENSYSIGLEGGKTWTNTVSNTGHLNVSASISESKELSHSQSTMKALSSKVSDTYGYNKTISEGGSETYESSDSVSHEESETFSSSVAYTTEEIKNESKTYSNAGAVEGYYRLVAATNLHVFAVVGYDIGSKTYFVNSFSVQDDQSYDFVDYSYSTHEFDDLEAGVLPFEIPYFVNEYVGEQLAESEGLVIDKNSGFVVGYTGKAKDVVIPDYVSMDSVNGKAEVIKILGISNEAFKGKDITSIKLGKYIKELPNSAFEGCNSLKSVDIPSIKYDENDKLCKFIIGSSTFKDCTSLATVNISSEVNTLEIGDSAFSGCTSLNDFKVGKTVKSIGSAAFDGVKSISVNPVSAAIIQKVCTSGAKNITIDISGMSDVVKDMSIAIPDTTESFELDGDKSIYNNLIISSKATTTIINKVSIYNDKTVPLTTTSKDIKLSSLELSSSTFGAIFSNAETKITIDGTVTVSSTGVGSILTKNIIIEQLLNNSQAKLVSNGDIYICKTITDNDLIKLDGHHIHIIDEDSFDSLKAGTLDWVLESEVPSGATIVDTKWTFDLTTNESSFNGQSLSDKEYEWSSYGSWSGWSRTKATSSSSRQVETKNVNDNVAYNINTYFYYKDPGALQFSYWNEGGNWQYYEFTQKTTDSPQMSVWGSYDGRTTYRIKGDSGIWGVNFAAEVWWMKSSVAVYNTHTEYRYRDRSKIYRNLESSTQVSSSSSVSNVQKWVKYVVD